MGRLADHRPKTIVDSDSLSTRLENTITLSRLGAKQIPNRKDIQYSLLLTAN